MCNEGKTGSCLNVNPARAGAAYGYVDMNADRLKQAESFGCATADLSTGDDLADIIADIVGEPLVDAAVDAVGFEARGHGQDAEEEPAAVLNDIMECHGPEPRSAFPGLYVTGDPQARDNAAKQGQIGVRLGLGWAKSHTFVTGQCPVKRYKRQLMNLILADKAHIAQAVNAKTISLDDAPRGYAEFDKGAARKYVIDLHGIVVA